MFGARLDRFDDLRVAGAAADVTGDGEADLLFARPRIRVEQRLRHHDHARRAEAALRAAVADEALLQRVQLAVLAEAFDRLQRRAMRLHREDEARAHRLAVQDDGAGAAVADVAALLGAGETGFVA